MEKKKKAGELKWKKVNGEFAPFWQPWNKKAAHPVQITGCVVGRKPLRGKWGERVIVEIELEGTDGERYALDTKTAALKALAAMGDGEMVRVTYKGEKKIKGRKTAMHDLDLETASA